MSEIFNEVEKSAKTGGTGKRAMWSGTMTISDPALIGETSSLALTFSLKMAKTDSDQAPITIKKVDRRTGQELITKEVVISQEGQINLKSHVERRSFTKDKFDPESLESGKNSFLPELVEKGFVEDVPAEHVAMIQDGQEVSQFDRVKEISIEGAVHLSRLSEYKIKEYYMMKPDDKHEKAGRVSKLARTLLERQVALKAFFSWGRGFSYYTAVIFPYERKEDGRLWLVMGLAEGRTTFDEAWSLETAQATTQKLEPVPLISKPKPKVNIS